MYQTKNPALDLDEVIYEHVENNSADIECISEDTDSELTEGKDISDYKITNSAYMEKKVLYMR